MLRRERLVAALFVLPAALLIAVFIYVPAGAMLHTSLHRQALTAPQTGPYCGADNYRAVADDADFHQSAANTLLFTVLVVPVQTLLALLLALWTNGGGAARRALRFAVFIPTTISLTVLAVLWKLLYAPATASGAGLFNGLLATLGLPLQPFLTSAEQAMYCIVAMSIWQGAGFQMMIFLSGLQTVPDQLYESAQLDGASSVRRFWHITLPGIAPTAMVVIMITTIFALRLFVQPYLMTRGGPRGSTQSVVQYMFDAAFTRRDLGIACAAGVLFFIALAAVTVAQRVSLGKTEDLT